MLQRRSGDAGRLDLDLFTARVVNAQERFNSVEAAARSNEDAATALSAAIDGFRGTLQELSFAGEELQSQNAELERAQHLIEAERERYQQLFELAPDAYLVTDEAALIMEANRPATELFGTEVRFLVGKPLQVFVAIPARASFREYVRQRPGQRPRPLSVQMLRRRSQSFPADITFAVAREPLREGHVLRWQIRDVSKRVELEQQLRLLNSDLDGQVAQRTLELQQTNDQLSAALADVSKLSKQLQRALDSRVIIEQAKGRLMEKAGIDAQQAFELLRDYSRNHNITLRQVARAVVDGRPMPGQGADSETSAAGRSAPTARRS